MQILSLQGVSLQTGGNRILDQSDLQVERGERIALAGRNGAGKTTLLRLMEGDVIPDAGRINRISNLRVAGLTQDVPVSGEETVWHFLVKGLGERGTLLVRYRQLLARQDEAALSTCHQAMEKADAWDLLPRIEGMASRLGLSPDATMGTLSGGMKRRVLLAAALAAEPDLLLLDEPTNHLDVPAIEWLENYLKNSRCTVVFVTHDRAFLQQVATRIVEIDRGKLYSYPGDYETWLVRREARLTQEQRHDALFDKRLAAEETWIRTGIKARRTRNEGRVRALKAMREEHQARRAAIGKTIASAPSGKRSGELVMEAHHLGCSLGGKPVIRDFSLLLLRGEKVGILGPNGCGKTTLVRMLLGELTPDAGTLRTGTGLEVAFFDQMRSAIEPEATVMHNVADGADFVTVDGKQKHVASWLREFLFTPECFNQPAKSLSGGERNRLMLAKMLAKPVNFLVMDEPTNDLDVETLELLEKLLVAYRGTLLLISHDREFINQVVTSVLAFEGDGVFRQYTGGYAEWKTQSRKAEPSAVVTRREKPQGAVEKRTFSEQRELDQLPDRIALVESCIAEWQVKMGSPDFYQQDPAEICAGTEALQREEETLAQLLARWEMLEAKKG